MDSFWTEVGLELPAGAQAVRVGLRLVAAALMGAAVGFEREVRGHEAGLRTHMHVALGAALFTLVPDEAGATVGDLAQVVKGVAAGIGFLGAGAILKMTAEAQIKGLTTAASIWLTAAVGLAVGAGWFWPAFVAIVLSWIILHLLPGLEKRIPGGKKTPNPDEESME